LRSDEFRRKDSSMRKLIFLVLLAGAAFVPYALTNKNWQANLSTAWKNLWNVPPGEPENAGLLARLSGATKALFVSKPVNPLATASLIPNMPVPPVVGTPVVDLGEVIRFDVTPEWIMERWGRVSTVLSEHGLEGYRVALVSGAQVDDLAGSLTYYFDQKRVVQRVTFRGTTGDGRRLIELAQRVYDFKLSPSVVSQLYTVKWSGKINSVLRLANPPVVRAGMPLSRVEALLEINRPNSPYGLSLEMQQLLTADAGFARR